MASVSALGNWHISYRLWLVNLLAAAGMVVITLLGLNAVKSETMSERRLQAREAVETAYSLLAHFERQVRDGVLDTETAQRLAKEAVKSLRYGQNNYFWINDMQPRMVMHPFKPELDGKDLSQIADPNGKLLFVAFVDQVRRAGEGFVDYFWPKAGSDVPVAKVSYVKAFAPWGWIVGSGVYVDDVEAVFWRLARQQGAAVALVLVVLVALIALVARSIVAPVRSLRSAILEVADTGRLDSRAPVHGHDELGETALAFNDMLKRIRGFVLEAHRASNRLSSGGDQLSRDAGQTLENMQGLREQSQQSATAMTEMTTSFRAVAASAETVAESARTSSTEADQGRTLVAETISSIDRLASDIEAAAGVIARLEGDAHNIGGILDVVRGIADQTSLLALNAAIEAARAGEQGRGFAVVADEVRTLAQRSQDSTEEIQDMIAHLQTAARDAVSAMEQGQARAKVTVEGASGTNGALERIAAGAMRISQMTDEIASAAEEQSVVADEISRSIVLMDDFAEKTGRIAESTVGQGQRITELLADLSDEMRWFKVGNDNGLDLSSAKAAHMAWKARLRAFLDGQASLSQEQAVSHRHCDFGKWYYAEGMQRYGNIPAVRELEAPHEELHRLIAAVIRARSQGSKAEAESLYRQVEPVSQRIVRLLDEVERESVRMAGTEGAQAG